MSMSILCAEDTE